MKINVTAISEQFRRIKINYYLVCLNPSPITRWQILDSSKLKEFADDNFKFDEIGRELSKQVENTVGKGEIARYEQFLLLPQCFQKACFPGASKGVIVWEWVTLSQTSPSFYMSAVQVLWKHCGKRWNCSEWAISPFPTLFSTLLENFPQFSSELKLLPANSFNSEESKIYRLGRINSSIVDNWNVQSDPCLYCPHFHSRL